MKFLTPYTQRADERGSMRGIINEGSWQEINYFETGRGQIRGGHYHKEASELFFILAGEIEITLSDLHGKELNRIIVRAGDSFIVEPLEVHTFKILQESRWINAMSKRIDADSPDIHTIV